MESLLRAAFMYLFLMFIVRIAGKRTLSEMTTFDFVLLLIIGDSSQQAITGADYSITNAVIVISTFVVLDMLLAFLKFRFRKVDLIIDGSPIILVRNGEVITKMMKYAKIDIGDILEAARKSQGIDSLEKIKFAILEKDGEISVIAN